MLVEKDVSERILSLYDAEDLELCEAYAVDAHLGGNLQPFIGQNQSISVSL